MLGFVPQPNLRLSGRENSAPTNVQLPTLQTLVFREYKTETEVQSRICLTINENLHLCLH